MCIRDSTYVERDLREIYDGRLFYGRDAFEGLRTMDRLVELKKSGEHDPLFGLSLIHIWPDLGLDAAEWPVPYWVGDAAFGVMTVLLCAVDASLGACVLGNFRGEDALADALGVPAAWRLFCAVVLGHPDGQDHPSRSLHRPRPDPDQRIHRGSWRSELPHHL